MTIRGLPLPDTFTDRQTDRHRESEVPESLLYDDGGRAAALVSLVFLVGAVAVLNDGRCLATATIALLCVVRTELALNEHRRLRHALVVDELHAHAHAHAHAHTRAYTHTHLFNVRSNLRGESKRA